MVFRTVYAIKGKPIEVSKEPVRAVTIESWVRVARSYVHCTKLFAKAGFLLNLDFHEILDFATL